MNRNLKSCGSSQPFGVGYPNGRLGLFNHAFEQLTGYTADELKSIDWAKALTPPEWQKIEQNKLGELQRTGQPVRYEKEYIRKDGSRVPVELLVHLVTAADGTPRYYYSFLTDITERRKTEAELERYRHHLEELIRERTAELEGANAQLQATITERERAEEASRESASAFATLANFVPQLVWMCTPDGLNVYFNQRWVEYTGLTLEESYGRGWNTPFHPDDKQAAWDAWNHATQTGEKYRVESRLRAADGSYRRFLMLGEPLTNAQGSVVRWFGTCTDIEDLKRAEEELRRSEEARKVAEAVHAERQVLQTALQRFYVVLSSMYSGVLLVMDEGWVEFANQAFCDLFGLEDAPADLVGLGPCDMIGKIKNCYLHPDEAVARIQEILHGGQPVKGEELAMQGGRTWLRDFVPLNVDGKSYGRLWIHSDITERERAEEELRELTQRLTYHVDHSPLVVIEWGPDMRLIRWSGAAERVFGWKAGEVLGKRMDDFRWIYQEDEPQVAEVSADLQTGRNPRSFSANRNYRKDGSVAHCEWYNSSLLDASGNLRSILSLVLDVTDRKRAEQALIRSEKLASVGRMAASIAHEINNPLAAVMNTIFLARMRADEPESVRQFLDMADDELKRIAHITRQTLGFYRDSSVPTIVSVHSVLDSAVDLLRGKVRVRGATIEKQYDGDLQVKAVPTELRQVFSNLLVNSLDAMGEEGIIKLRVSKSTCVNRGQPRIRITVADDGKGIDAATLPRIFEPLFTTKEATGSGLGLWVSKQLIEKHGGAIRVRSSSKGPRRGTVFSIFLPAEAPG